MDIAAGYKMTEIGVIPEDWNVVKFDDIFDLSTSSIKTEDFDVSNYVSTENLLQQKKGVMPYLSDISYASVKEYLVNDILVSNIRPYLKKIWLSDKNAGCSSDVLVVRCKANGLITPSFAYYPLSDDKFFSYATDTAIGTKMPRGDKKAIREYKFALPSSTDEQVRISKTILDFDKYIEGIDIEIAKKKQLKDGTMQELLTGKTRLAGFSGEWVEKYIEDICSDITTGKLDANAMTTFGKYPFFTCAKICYRIDVYDFDTEALMISGNGEHLGYVHYYTGKFNAYQRTYVLSDFSEDIKYVKYYLDKFFRKKIEGEKSDSNTPYITIGTVQTMPIYMPKDKAEQVAIVRVLSDLDAEIKALEAERDKYALIKQGMMQKLLTGQIRLK